MAWVGKDLKARLVPTPPRYLPRQDFSSTSRSTWRPCSSFISKAVQTNGGKQRENITCLGLRRKTSGEIGIESWGRKLHCENISGWGTSQQRRPEPENNYNIKYLWLITSRGDPCGCSPPVSLKRMLSLLFSLIVPFTCSWVGQQIKTKLFS